MRKFKIGDVVECVKRGYLKEDGKFKYAHTLNVGSIYVVSEEDAGGIVYNESIVMLDENNWWQKQSNFKLKE